MSMPHCDGMEEQRWRAAQASGGTSSPCIYAHVERVLIEHGASGKVLDFGAGKGSLIQRLYDKKMFLTCIATDLMPRSEQVDSPIAWQINDLNQRTSFDDQSFDVVVSVEVIEHLENPRATVREWARLLKPGGLLVFSTPNNESYRSIVALIFRGHYAAFGDSSYPAHITPLLRKDIQRIMRESGFHREELYFTNVGQVPKLTRFTWQALSFGICRGVRFSDNIIFAARKPGSKEPHTGSLSNAGIPKRNGIG
jgi:2-polyprenyl-3-methyl-5-hydroxy-6-metoxy-1,4-benzoquinol methylase